MAYNGGQMPLIIKLSVLGILSLGLFQLTGQAIHFYTSMTEDRTNEVMACSSAPDIVECGRAVDAKTAALKAAAGAVEKIIN